MVHMHEAPSMLLRTEWPWGQRVLPMWLLWHLALFSSANIATLGSRAHREGQKKAQNITHTYHIWCMYIIFGVVYLCHIFLKSVFITLFRYEEGDALCFFIPIMLHSIQSYLYMVWWKRFKILLFYLAIPPIPLFFKFYLLLKKIQSYSWWSFSYTKFQL